MINIHERYHTILSNQDFNKAVPINPPLCGDREYEEVIRGLYEHYINYKNDLINHSCSQSLIISSILTNLTLKETILFRSVNCFIKKSIDRELDRKIKLFKPNRNSIIELIKENISSVEKIKKLAMYICCSKTEQGTGYSLGNVSFNLQNIEQLQDDRELELFYNKCVWKTLTISNILFNMEHLPRWYASASELKQLMISLDELFPHIIPNIIRNITTIDFRNCNLIMVPDLMELPHLESFCLDDNLITKIPVKILNRYRTLQRISFNNNQITEIPEELNLPQLTMLSGNNNKITKVPTLPLLKSLKVADLNNNPLVEIPNNLHFSVWHTVNGFR